MKQDHQRFDDNWLSRVSSGFTAWVLGTGLLTLHIAVYLLACVGLLFWDLYRSPNDIGVDVTLRRWGFVVLFHAIAVGAGWVAWLLLRIDLTHAPDHVPQRQGERERLLLPRANGTPQATDFDIPVRRPRDPAPVMTTASAVAEEWARRWLRESMRVMSHTVSMPRAALAQGDRTMPVPSDLAGPTLSEWGGTVVHRARSMMVSARGRLTSLTQSESDSDLSAMPRFARDPASTWPTWAGTRPVQPPSTSADASPPGVSPPVERTAAPPAQSLLIPPENGVDPLRSFASMSNDTPEHHDPAADPRWSWVEAAAAAWLARREADVTHSPEKSEPDSQNPPVV
jgi:hypothetical protein